MDRRKLECENQLKGGRSPKRRHKAFLRSFFGSTKGEMNWIQRKIYLYNVTFGLYMLDWWERCLFNILVVVLLWFVCTRCFDLLQISLKGNVGVV